MDERGAALELPGGYSLHRYDENTWWFYRGRMNMALKIVPSVPCGPGGSIDREVMDLVAALSEAKAPTDNSIGANAHLNMALAEARAAIREAKRIMDGPDYGDEVRSAYLAFCARPAVQRALEAK